MSQRTSILLDDESRAAARELAAAYGCSVSEAIRRAIVRQRDQTVRVGPERIAERRRALQRLFELFEGHDAEAEIARLKAEDQFA